ncbi:MAG: hypothetical protein DRI34_09485 [Deltaproteobacteria bacterium]|nr:MAG: hypothetical protein DRI34_09485 [Deltaproteobacteria bacterium]
MRYATYILLAVVAGLVPVSCRGGGGSGIPPGLIAMFDGECPAGWSRYEQLDGRFPRGALEAGGSGGEESHVHSFDITARTSKDGAHVHMLARGEQVEVDPGFFGHVGIYKGYLQGFEEGGRDRAKALRARAVTDSDGAHDHLISVQGDTEPASSLPPYLELVFCRKD